MAARKKKEVEPQRFKCEFCTATFAKESTLLNHVCPKKQRMADKDELVNRVAFSTYSTYYKISYRRNVTYEHFVNSTLFSGFMKFAWYCINTFVLNRERYVDYLIKENIKLDLWHLDTTYCVYLHSYLRTENAMDAVRRSVDFLCGLCDSDGCPVDEVFTAPISTILAGIVAGKLSPWVLYNCDSGVNFLGKLSEDQVKLVYDYIEPSRWAVVFSRRPDDVAEVKAILKEAGW